MNTKQDEQLGNLEADVIFIDQIGVLAELYTFSDFAFVGGSFGRHRQVHSVMEALAAGCLTFVGPSHQNNREALEFQNLFVSSSKSSSSAASTPAVVCVASSEEWQEKLKSLLHCNSGPLSDSALWKQEIQSLVQQRTGATQAVVDWVFKN